MMDSGRGGKREYSHLSKEQWRAETDQVRDTVVQGHLLCTGSKKNACLISNLVMNGIDDALGS